LFRLTWKPSATPSGRPISRLRASVPRTSGSGSILAHWTSPCVEETDEAPETKDARNLRHRQAGKMKGVGSYKISTQALMTAWPSPVSMGGRDTYSTVPPSIGDTRGYTLGMAATLAHWPTPRTPSGGPETAAEKQARGEGHGGGDLAAVAKTAGWATPAARDYRWPNERPYAERGGGKKGEQLQNQVHHLLAPGETPSGCPAGTEGYAPFRGRLNPCLPRWLQGLPLSWDLCAMGIPRSFLRSSSRPRTAGRGSAGTATPSAPPRPQGS